MTGPGAAPAAAAAERILTIKLGALGDFVQAMGPFAAIRRHHDQAHHVLLTTAPFVCLAEASGQFDEIWTDRRPKWWRPREWRALSRRLNDGGFSRVYDLQTSDRSSWYFRLFRRPRPEWSGIAAGCSHPHANPGRDAMHTVERQAEQLELAGIAGVPPPDLSGVPAPEKDFGIARPFVLLVPGGAAHRPAKRWPADRYAVLAQAVAARGFLPVLLGTEVDRPATAAVAAACEGARDLTGATTLLDVLALARRAAGAVGNDSGPMHLLAAAGCPSLVLFSAASNPQLCAPRGADVAILRRDRLEDLPMGEVEAALRLR